ncbi:porin family protein [Pedomonas mirosovicensis]|uniref:porin family protein n=1 Tax=Pedomonas mirosovicensis TaxID=2908641 RepID=UPI0021683FD8|nr:porin family protein [Pedomonas mirosovicensis]MCH8684838.1 porin family protein [Pedomonas mirosovicensis]
MKKLLAASLLAMTVSAPAFAADFTGPRVGFNIGLADNDFLGDDTFTYGFNAGYDHAFGKLIVGGTVEYQEGEDAYGRDLSATVRLGTKVAEQAMVYGLVGYTNQGIENTPVELDGVRLGLGAEVAFNQYLFGNVEYRYSNYEAGAELHQTLVGIGFRF